MLEHTLVELLSRSVISNPNGVYARFNGQPFTYAELDRDSGSLACGFMAQGLTKGDRVAVMMNNSLMALTVIFALSKAGLVWIPVNAQQRGEGLRYILDHSEPRLLIADADLVPLMLDALGKNSLPIYSNGEADLAIPLSSLVAFSQGFKSLPPGLDDPFAIMYTSGTTGRPKGAIVSHQMLLLASEAVSLVSGAQRDDVFFVWEALYHIGGAQLLPLPMTHGIRLAMVDRFSASRFWEQAKQEGATHIHHLGGILQLLLKQPPTPLDQEHGVKIAWGGGCPSDIWGAFQNRFGIMIRECYGMTEASSITTYNDTGLVGSVGKPIPWFSVQLLDEHDNPVQCGERGQIVVRENLDGALFPGYFRNPEVTAKTLRAGALYTGDLGSFDADGNMFFHGRMSDSVRCKGENVSAWEVEHVAAENPHIEDCAMIGVPSDIGEQDIKLFVKCKSGSSLTATELSVWLAQRLAPYQNPRYLAFVEDFERTASQRIMKHKLSPQLDDCWDRFAK